MYGKEVIKITSVQSSLEGVARVAILARKETVPITCGSASGIEIKTKKI